ncbi:PREDICTED: centromere protein O-like [Priapulus caudatus]|uniref:Centromere protein O n=1 Tax=Priapulus caudatus TaxID=37621 RepID=A0ABM1E9S7_PRICU|nr:PREDICTED: centromere protein O-like [Priapulus caudatus]
MLTFNTAFQNKYYEPYYLELSSELRVCHHTLPPFVPLQVLLERYLYREKNVQQFLFELSNYLCSYVSRREQVNALQDNVKLVKESLQTSQSFDFVRFHLDCGTELDCGCCGKDMAEVIMTYDLKSIFPTTVKVRGREHSLKVSTDDCEYFKKMILPRAVDSMLTHM